MMTIVNSYTVLSKKNKKNNVLMLLFDVKNKTVKIETGGTC
jgi:hypothetical protein